MGEYQVILDNVMTEDECVLLARQLRLTVVKSVYDQGLVSENDAKELLNASLTPGPDSADVDYDDSALLNDPDALSKLEAEYGS